MLISTTVPDASVYPDYDPSSLLFDARHRKQVLLSDAGLLVVLGALSTFGYYNGLSALVKYYGISYLYVNHWLVMVRLSCSSFRVELHFAHALRSIRLPTSNTLPSNSPTTARESGTSSVEPSAPWTEL